ncbi:MAG: TolC family protein [Desulfobulbaceae bacterium]|nr:TolC family protein [Desulfobulbaceae bacterium]
MLLNILIAGLGYAAEEATGDNVILSLDELIQIALTNNPQVDSAFAQKDQREGQLTQARSSYLPQLSINGDYSRVKVDGLQPEDEGNIAHGGANVSQLIYDFGGATGAIDAGRANLEASFANLEKVSQGIVLQVRQACYKVLERKHLIKVAEQAVSNYEQHLDRAKEYFKAGVRTRIDVVNAEVELSSARLRLLQSQYDLKSARVELERILGKVPSNGKYALVPILDGLDRLHNKMPPLPGPLAKLLETANEQRQDILQQKAFIKTAEAVIRQADSGYWPSIGATAGLDTYDTDLSTFQDQWNVGVGFTWELFSGFRTRGKQVEAKAFHRENLYRLHDLELMVTQEVTDSLIRADENRESVLLNMETVRLATENLKLASERYKAGLNDMIEYNDAELRFTTAQGNLIASYFAYLSSLARIDYSIGTPAPLIAQQ